MNAYTKEFYEFEKKYDNFIIQGLQCWHLFRYHIFNLITKYQGEFDELHPDENVRMGVAEKIKLGLSFVINSIVYSTRRLKKNKDFLLVCTPRKIKYNNICYYPIIEPLFELYKNDINYVERPYRYKHEKTKSYNASYSDGIELMRLFNLLRKKYWFDEDSTDLIKALLSDINNTFNIEIPESVFAHKMQDVWVGFHTYCKCYDRVLKRVKPKYVVEVVHYDTSQLALSFAAHNNNIKVIELQHGTISDGHIAYNFSNRNNFVPDYFLSFGDFWNDSVSFPVNMISVGFSDLENKVKRIKTETDEEKAVLFLSQGPVGNVLVKYALELEKYYKTNNISKRIIYKLHPSEYLTWKENYPELVSTDIQVVDNNENHLYYYFNVSDVQVGVSSTAIYEGLAFGLKTIICKAYSYEYMDYLINSNNAEFVECVEEFTDKVNALTNTSIDIDYYWKNNVISNFQKVIDSLVLEEGI